MLSEMRKDGLVRLFEVLEYEPFTFLVNDRNVKSTFPEALLLSHAVYSEFQCESTRRRLKVCADGIDENNFAFVLKMIRNEIDDNIEISEEREFSFLSILRSLGNERHSLKLLSLMHARRSSERSTQDLFPCNGTSANVVATSTHLMNNECNVNYCASPFDSYSMNELSRLDRHILHALLSSETHGIETDDSLLDTLIDRGSNYYEYWQYIQVCFLS
jgi:hypothetical protein